MTLLLGLAIRSSIVLAAGLVLSACLAKRSAALRHRVLAAALMAARLDAPFRDPHDVRRRSGLSASSLVLLAQADAWRSSNAISGVACTRCDRSSASGVTASTAWSMVWAGSDIRTSATGRVAPPAIRRRRRG